MHFFNSDQISCTIPAFFITFLNLLLSALLHQLYSTKQLHLTFSCSLTLAAIKAIRNSSLVPNDDDQVDYCRYHKSIVDYVSPTNVNFHCPQTCYTKPFASIFYVFVTGSAKTGHNRTSLNLQHKALNTLGAYLRIEIP